VLFTALNAFLESFFFHRGDPVWLFFVLGVLGLRQVSLRPIAVRDPPIAARDLPDDLDRASPAKR
jgi:O-antigen ligase